MEINDIKKILYKEKPLARKSACFLTEDNEVMIMYLAESSTYRHIFIIPEKEAKDFNDQEPAQLLIRWLDGNVPIKPLESE